MRLARGRVERFEIGRIVLVARRDGHVLLTADDELAHSLRHPRLPRGRPRSLVCLSFASHCCCDRQ